MGRPSKRFREIAKMLDVEKTYSIEEAVDILKKVPAVKFDQSLEISLKLGVDPRKADQNIRGTVSLPNGTGKTIKILVFAHGEKVKEALDAGADLVGSDEYFKKVAGGFVDFDAVIATPDLMREVGKLGKVLGPRGLMPSPKAGTVTNDVVKAVGELKAGKIEFKVDRNSVINAACGKVSFDGAKLVENVQAFLDAILRLKPASAKGNYIQSLVLSTTMGPGVKIELRNV